MWYNEYIGKPWASPANPPHSFNCGDLARYIYQKHLGIDAPEIHVGCESFRGHVREIESYFVRAGCVQVKDRQPFDVVRMSLGKRPCHIGVYTGEGILHSLEGIGVVHESTFELKSQYKLEYLRHASRI